MRETIDYLLKKLVDFPDRLRVDKKKLDNVTILEISAEPADIGKIIGKEGRVIKAIRAIVSAATIKEKNKTIIEIIESKNQ
ncbi:MAG: KH domain-containing protein [Atribacterota bacterium]